MNANLKAAYGRILKKELVAAMGCTEPIAIAYAAAKCREVLGAKPENCHVRCSGNIVKNVMGVTVPNSGGLKGIDVAATLGILGGDASRDLEVLQSVTEEHIDEAKLLLAKGFCTCALEQGVDPAPIVKGIAAALRFDRAGDATAPELQRALREQGIDHVLEHYMSLKPDEPLYGMIKEAFR